MTNCFHLAIPAGNIKTALGFYCDILGCETGNQEEGRWIDINFWGNELTLHETKTKQVRERHDVIRVMFVFRILVFTLKLEILLKLKKELRRVKSTILTIPTEGLLVQNLNKRLFL